ncbi:MAG: glycosyltransferase [Lachnospiraceae bacterium]|nr:glycosyltransferase [Lachnospiraceae bacterium]
MKFDPRNCLYERLRARHETNVQSFRKAAEAQGEKEGEGRETKERRVPFQAKPAQDAFPCTVSIVIPSRDNPGLLSQCLSSVRRTVHPERERLQAEIIVVDNGSTTENRSKINDILDACRTDGWKSSYLYREEPFSFSRMCNRGAAEAKGDLLLFLNDDVEALADGWLSELASLALTKGVGAVGAKLLYPGEEKRIQHCGIVNMRIGPVHVLNGRRDTEVHAQGFNRAPMEVIAVTGACLLLRRELFAEAGGFREALPVAFNDVDLCYTLFEKGYKNVCDNAVALTHHESFSRGDDTQDIKKTMRLAGEYRVLMEAHRSLIGTDPYRSDDLLRAVDLHAESDASGADMTTLHPVREYRPLSGQAKEDPVHFTGVEYANRLMLALKREEAASVADPETLLDYYIRGYSFVIGADNALYEKEILLQRLRIEEDDSVVPTGPVLCFAAEEMYRPDIERRIGDQTHCALCGFQLLIGRGTLPDGVYRIGVLAHRRYSRQRIYHWGKTVLYVNDGQ